MPRRRLAASSPRVTFAHTAALALGLGSATAQDTPELSPGTNLQRAIDDAPPGAVLRLAAGTFRQRVEIRKPITLLGAGWDKTILSAEAGDEPTIRTKSATVTLQHLQLNGPAPTNIAQGMRDTALLECDGGHVAAHDCAFVGPFYGGVGVLAGAQVELRRCLVAAIWNIGVRCEGRTDEEGRKARVHIVDSDIRNCYHRCIAGVGDGGIVERCRISGSAWHGIVLGGTATIRKNLIFGHARFGIYASGPANALVRDNVFWRNAMAGVSCWFDCKARFERNTFVGNLREGFLAVGGAKPTLVDNVFTDHALAISCSAAGGHEDRGLGEPVLEGNVFARNEQVLSSGLLAGVPKRGARVTDVQYQDAAAFDFTVLAPEGKGAHAPLPLASPWPLQPGELAIIPDDRERRDFGLWKRQ